MKSVSVGDESYGMIFSWRLSILYQLIYLFRLVSRRNAISNPSIRHLVRGAVLLHLVSSRVFLSAKRDSLSCTRGRPYSITYLEQFWFFPIFFCPLSSIGFLIVVKCKPILTVSLTFSYFRMYQNQKSQKQGLEKSQKSRTARGNKRRDKRGKKRRRIIDSHPKLYPFGGKDAICSVNQVLAFGQHARTLNSWELSLSLQKFNPNLKGKVKIKLLK